MGSAFVVVCVPPVCVFIWEVYIWVWEGSGKAGNFLAWFFLEESSPALSNSWEGLVCVFGCLLIIFVLLMNYIVLYIVLNQ